MFYILPFSAFCHNFATKATFGKKSHKNHYLYTRKTTHSMNYNVFISSKSEDYPYARQVYNLLVESGLKVFLADRELSKTGRAEYGEVIDEALDSSEHLIVVASNAEYVRSSYVKNEWRIFLEEKRSGRKSGNIITILTDGVKVSELPVSLRHFQSFPFDQHEQVINYITKSDAHVEQPRKRQSAKPKTSKAGTEQHKQGGYAIGDLYDDGTKRGVVFEVSDDGLHGKIVSIEHSRQMWAYGNWLGAFGSSSMPCNKTIYTTDGEGEKNMQRVMATDNWQHNYPAFAWCRSLGEEWYLPTIEEYQSMLSHRNNTEAINLQLKACGTTELFEDGRWYWTSVEDDSSAAKFVYLCGLSRLIVDNLNKSNTANVRAVAKF